VLDDPSALLGILLALLAALLFAWSNVSLARSGAAGRGIGAVGVSMWFALGLVVVPVLAVAAAVGRPVPPPASLGLALVAGGVALLVGRLLFWESLALVGPSRASMVKNASPVVVVLLAGAVLGEWPTPLAGLGIAAVVGGVVQHGLSGDDRRVAAAEPRLAVRGLAIGLAAAAAFAVGDVLVAVAVRTGGDPVVLGAVVFLGAWAAAVVVAPGSPVAQLRALRDVGRPLAVASATMGVARLLAFVAIGLVFVPYVAAIVATAPLLTAVIGRLSGAQEVLTARLGVSMLLVVAGGAAIAVGG